MWLRILLTATLLLPCLKAQVDEKQAWKHFVEWYKTYPRIDMPPQIMKAYAAELASAGVAPEQIKERLGAIQKAATGSPRELMEIHFNKVYTTPGTAPFVFTREANAFMARVVAGLKPGKALDVGMGQGRNAVYLAQKGWDVAGYDVSDKGLAEAQENAAKGGVKIRTVLKGHEDFDFGKEQWDLVVMTYSFAPMSDAAFLRRVKESLKPDGIVLVEQFNSPSTSGAKGPANALLKSFEDLRILHYEDTTAKADWGGSAGATSRIGRLAAQKDK